MPEAGEDDEHAFEAAGEVLDLLVAVGVRAVGRPGRVPQRDVRRHRRDQVHETFQRIGEQADRPGDGVGRPLHPDRDEGREDRQRDRPAEVRRAVAAWGNCIDDCEVQRTSASDDLPELPILGKRYGWNGRHHDSRRDLAGGLARLRWPGAARASFRRRSGQQLPRLTLTKRGAIDPDVSSLSTQPAKFSPARPEHYRRLTAAECRLLAIANTPLAEDLDAHPANDSPLHALFHRAPEIADQSRFVRGYAADEIRNRAAAAALEDYYRLAAAEGQFDLAWRLTNN